MKSKRAVTEPVLIIGVLVIAATMLLLGTTRVLVPLIKTQSEFLANDIGLTVHAVYAAPENLKYDFVASTPKGKDLMYVFFTASDLRETLIYDGGPTPKKYAIVKDTKIKQTFADGGLNAVGWVTYYPDNIKGLFSIKVIKKWDEINQKNSVKFCNKC